MTKPVVDKVLLSIEHGIDLQNRRLFLMSNMDENAISKIIQGLLHMEASSKEKIEMFVSTFGGSMYEMFALYDAMRQCAVPIHINAIGKCMSAGILIVAAGTKGHRYAYPNTWFMTHQGWGDQTGSATELKSAAVHFEEIMKSQYNLLAKHTSRDAKYWKKLLEQPKDIFFDADEAIEHGLIDAIWESK